MLPGSYEVPETLKIFAGPLHSYPWTEGIGGQSSPEEDSSPLYPPSSICNVSSRECSVSSDESYGFPSVSSSKVRGDIAPFSCYMDGYTMQGLHNNPHFCTESLETTPVLLHHPLQQEQQQKRSRESEQQVQQQQVQERSPSNSSSSSSSSSSVPKGVGKTCHICLKSFTRKTSLQTHMLIHTKVKPYRCSYQRCNKTFNVKSNLYRHERIHKRNNSRQPVLVI
ncbi:C2H2-type zinc finger protein Ecym_8388 [Eremothecium cymbalariae DBVPG|uniref:C2H2-type domain-containing protein n=1 Tax=Eremothecium cymbalariae (strain CBS 270.75 / DBVPG 7215 / KCTC 17166 / NRRL Y-17582) TaxID=931890 RepID=G8JXT4_ERECY|nr:Hypothetical protein Ecym_8388 [Eremothecium cymbalariae DBVPG\